MFTQRPLPRLPRHWIHTTVGLAILTAIGGCRADPAERKDAKPAASPTGPPPGSAAASPTRKAPAPAEPDDVPRVATRFEAAKRVVAIGDVHGDLEATRSALRIAGVLDDQDHWSGGETVLVQTGDQLDRGDDEPEILALFERLRAEAEQAGGAVHVLNGNHELMNAVGDFRYVTPEGFDDFAATDTNELPRRSQSALRHVEPEAHGRAAAFIPGGTWARKLAHRNTVVIVGDTVFVHGGVEPKWATRIDQLNQDVRAYLMGAAEDPKQVVTDFMAQDGVVWSRAFSEPEVDAEACARLARSLHVLGASRMVVGHTVQKDGITSACDDKVWRIDVGMAAHYGGTPQALLIEDGKVTVLKQ